MNLKIRCHLIGVNFKLLTYPQQPIFKGGESRNNYAKKYLRLPLQPVTKRVWQFWIVKKLCGGGDSYRTLCIIFSTKCITINLFWSCCSSIFISLLLSSTVGNIFWFCKKALRFKSKSGSPRRSTNVATYTFIFSCNKGIKMSETFSLEEIVL